MFIKEERNMIFVRCLKMVCRSVGVRLERLKWDYCWLWRELVSGEFKMVDNYGNKYLYIKEFVDVLNILFMLFKGFK